MTTALLSHSAEEASKGAAGEDLLSTSESELTWDPKFIPGQYLG